MAQMSREDLLDLVGKIAPGRGLPTSLALAQSLAESTGDPEARNASSGALGLFQVMPRTGASMGFSPSDLVDPVKGAQAGLGYLSQMLQRFGGDPRLALSAYNAGPGATRRAGGVHPAAAPYVDKIGAEVGRLTAPGQPLEEEAQGAGATYPDAAHRDEMARIIDQLVPQSDQPQYNQAGIRRMLALNYGQ